MKKQISNISPTFIKKAYRLVRYRNERKKFIREIGIRKQQNKQLAKEYDPHTKRLIVFLIPGSDWETGKDKISGGIISIVSLCEETAAIQNVHKAQTIMCTMNGEHLLVKHTMFGNNTNVFRFEQLASFFTEVTDLILHIPEFLVEYFEGLLNKADIIWLQKIETVHVNIMNQNIKLMPETVVIEEFKKKFSKITATTAHQKYCSKYYRDYFDIPIHKFSVWISPEQYSFRKWGEKENLIVVSPDEHLLKDETLRTLQQVPGLKVQIIQNLTYNQYKELIARAKWSLTFGEGLDGYLIEPVFSGAIGFAVYNEAFFTPDFQGLQTIYPSYDNLIQKIVANIESLDNENSYKNYQQELFTICAKYYSKEQYRKNIIAFYEERYSLS